MVDPETVLDDAEVTEEREVMEEVASCALDAAAEVPLTGDMEIELDEEWFEAPPRVPLLRGLEGEQGNDLGMRKEVPEGEGGGNANPLPTFELEE